MMRSTILMTMFVCLPTVVPEQLVFYPVAAASAQPIGAPTQADAGHWSSTGALNVPRSGHAAVALPGGRALVAGGVGTDCCSQPSTSVETSVEIYEPAMGTWHMAAPMHMTRYDPAAIALLDGRILLIGGDVGRATSEIYDPIADAWSSPVLLTSDRFGFSATRLASGKVLVAGGYSFGNLSSAELFDPATNTWRATGGLRAARYGHTATLLEDGRVLAVGGEFDYDFENSDVLKSTELYDPASETWSTATELNRGADGHSAVRLVDGSVLILGGLLASDNAPERFDPRSGIWHDTGKLATGRVYFTATVLPNGRVLVAGGTTQDSGSYLNTSEVYDPDGGTWTSASSLVVGRWGHTATLLTSGKVLVAGGVGGNATAELFEPVTLSSGSIGPGFTGSWYDPAQSGHGLILEVLPGNRFYANWFAFNPSGTQQAWFTGVGSYSGNTATITAVDMPTGGRWIPNFDPTQVVHNPWGTLTFTFTDCNHGTVNFNSVIGYGAGSMNLMRLTQLAGLSCP